MKRHNLTKIILLLLFANLVFAESSVVSTQYEERYHSLLNELRCLVCQNQTIAESDADLAKDLRIEVKKMLEKGASDADIIDFMVNRYGDFVLYKPLVKPKTYLLWFGPFIILAIVLIILYLVIKRQSKVSGIALTPEEQEKLNSALDQDNNTDD